jgi:hypothetical protein
VRHQAPTPERPTYAAIMPEELLPLAVVKQRLRWGDQTIAEAQRKGLRTLAFGKWKYTRGKDLIEFLERVGTANNHQEEPLG